MLEALALRFRIADAVLRPIAWTPAQQVLIACQLARSQALAPFAVQPLRHRVQSAYLFPDMLTAALFWLAVRDLSTSFDRCVAERRTP